MGITPEPIGNTGDIIAGDAACLERDRILLGKLAELGPRRRLGLDVTGEQVVAILGKRGAGKSYALRVPLRTREDLEPLKHARRALFLPEPFDDC